MNILDENILEGQRQLLLKWRVPFRQIGYEVGHQGMTDEHRLYAVYSEAKGLITEFPEDRAFDCVTVADQPWQAFYNGGIAAAFLSRLYMGR